MTWSSAADRDERPPGSAADWPFASGEMAERIRSFDWSATPLGPIAKWPQSLRTAIDILLCCGFPATLQWTGDAILLYNDPYREVIGSRHPSAFGHPIFESFPEIVAPYGPIFDRVRQGETVVFEDQVYRYVRNNRAEDAWFTMTYIPVRAESGAVAGVFVIGVETTSKAALRESEERHAFLLSLGDAVRTIADPNRIICISAEMLCRHLRLGRCGFGELDATGEYFTVETEWSDGVMPSMTGTIRLSEFGPEILAQFRAAETVVINDNLGDARTQGAEEAFERIGSMRAGVAVPLVRDGRFIAALYAHQSSPRTWTGSEVALIREVAERSWAAVERARAEAAQRLNESKYRTLFESIDTGFCIVEVLFDGKGQASDYRFVEANPAFARETGLVNVIGQTMREIAPAHEEFWFRTYGEVARSGEPRRFQHAAVALGSMYDVFAFRIDNPAHNLVAVLFTDIQDRLRAEEALRQSEKLAVVGRLASSIAHEINNPLEAVINLLYLAQQSSTQPDVAKWLDLAQAELARVSHMTTETLRFHRQSTAPDQVDVEDLVESVLLLHEGRLRAADVVTVRCFRPHPLITCFANEIRQVLANLIGNAIDAMALNSTLRRLTVSIRQATHPLTGASGVRVTVMDAGAGIRPADRMRIFEPFFTTKENTGTGLGLWVSMGIVKKHRGSLTFHSSMGPERRGTAFSIFLCEEFA